MDIRIVNVILDVFDEYGETIRNEIDRFEEALNDEAPDLLEECYLVILGFKHGIFEAMIFDEEIDVGSYVYYLENEVHISQDEALFVVSVMETLLDNIGYYFEIPDIERLTKEAYQRNDFYQLFIIGKTYFLGFGVSQDYEKAFEIYTYLYSQEYSQATYYLGFMYEKGYGIEKDIDKALMYYKSTESDLCHFRLGVFHMLGQYVEQDDQKAIDHLSLSHYHEAYLYKGLLLEKQGEHALAFESFFNGAKLYQPECLYKVAMAFKLGIGISQNIKEAYRYFEYGYYLMHGDSAYQLSMFYFNGVNGNKDEQKALNYLEEAAELYSYDACMLMGQFCEKGSYMSKDAQLASSYYQKAEDIQAITKNIIIESFEEEV